MGESDVAAPLPRSVRYWSSQRAFPRRRRTEVPAPANPTCRSRGAHSYPRSAGCCRACSVMRPLPPRSPRRSPRQPRSPRRQLLFRHRQSRTPRLRPPPRARRLPGPRHRRPPLHPCPPARPRRSSSLGPGSRRQGPRRPGTPLQTRAEPKGRRHQPPASRPLGPMEHRLEHPLGHRRRLSAYREELPHPASGFPKLSAEPPGAGRR